MSLLRLGWAYFTHRLILPVAAIGIALGVAVLFAVLAVFQGFPPKAGSLEGAARVGWVSFPQNGETRFYKEQAVHRPKGRSAN